MHLLRRIHSGILSSDKKQKTAGDLRVVPLSISSYEQTQQNRVCCFRIFFWFSLFLKDPFLQNINPVNISKRATIGPPAKRHSNGVYAIQMAFRWRADGGPTLYADCEKTYDKYTKIRYGLSIVLLCYQTFGGYLY